MVVSLQGDERIMAYHPGSDHGDKRLKGFQEVLT